MKKIILKMENFLNEEVPNGVKVILERCSFETEFSSIGINSETRFIYTSFQEMFIFVNVFLDFNNGIRFYYV